MRPRPRLRLRTPLVATGVTLAAGLSLTSCGGPGGGEGPPGGRTTTVSTNRGDVEVPVNPIRVAVLDNTAFATVRAFGVEPVALPKGLLPRQDYQDWKKSSAIKDVGDHKEPRLEALNAARPDLIIGGYRFSGHHAKLSKIATTIDIAPSDENYVDALRKQTATLGRIFGQEKKAGELVAGLDAAEDAAAKAVHGESVFLGVTSAGRIDNGASRIGRLLERLDLRNVLPADGQDSTSVHNNSGLAPETIAQLDPEWMILLDRDSAVAEGGGQGTPARQLVEGQEAWADSTFRRRNQVVYLPADFYLTEGIESYTRAFDQLTAAFTASR